MTPTSSSTSGESGAPQFVLDRADNPHPRMLDRALCHRRLARMQPDNLVLGLRWLTYLEAMCDATGLPPEQIDAWVAGHETFDPIKALAKPVAVPVPIRAKGAK